MVLFYNDSADRSLISSIAGVRPSLESLQGIYGHEHASEKAPGHPYENISSSYYKSNIHEDRNHTRSESQHEPLRTYSPQSQRKSRAGTRERDMITSRQHRDVRDIPRRRTSHHANPRRPYSPRSEDFHKPRQSRRPYSPRPRNFYGARQPRRDYFKRERGKGRREISKYHFQHGYQDDLHSRYRQGNYYDDHQVYARRDPNHLSDKTRLHTLDKVTLRNEESPVVVSQESQNDRLDLDNRPLKRKDAPRKQNMHVRQSECAPVQQLRSEQCNESQFAPHGRRISEEITAAEPPVPKSRKSIFDRLGDRPVQHHKDVKLSEYEQRFADRTNFFEEPQGSQTEPHIQQQQQPASVDMIQEQQDGRKRSVFDRLSGFHIMFSPYITSIVSLDYLINSSTTSNKST